MKHLMYRLCTFTCFLGIAPITFAWWHYTEGFVWDSAEWWRWLFYEIATNGMPPEFKYSFAVISVTLLTAGFIVLAVGIRSGAVTVSGGRSVSESHGSARFATLPEMKKLSLFRQNGVVVGGIRRGVLFWSRIDPLFDDGPAHNLIFAPSRSGKGISLVIPTLLNWAHSAIVYDIKGENWALTSGYRASAGQRIIRFEPAADAASGRGLGARYNPIGGIRTGTSSMIADVQRVALMIVDPDGKGLKDHWDKSAYKWMACILMHVICRAPLLLKREANMGDVLTFMSSGKLEGEQDDIGTSGAAFVACADKGGEMDAETGDEQLSRTLTEMMAFDHKDEIANVFVRNGASAMDQKPSRERGSIISSAEAGLTIYADPVLISNIATSDFEIRDLMHSTEPVTLYVVIEPNDEVRLRPLIRLLFDQFVSQLTTGMEFEDGKTKAHYKHRLLMLLDEFCSLGKMETIQKALAYSAGYGVKFYMIVQGMEQLHEHYSREEAISTNCRIQSAFAPTKNDTAEMLSKKCGQTTIITKRSSVQRGSGFGSAKSITDSTQETGRPLLTVDEVLKIEGFFEDTVKKTTSAGRVLVFVSGWSPIHGHQWLFFKDAEALRKTKILPFETALPKRLEGPKSQQHDSPNHDSEGQDPSDPSSSLPSNSTAKTSPRPAHGERASTTHKGDNS